jgi:AcrR family transcriptional regulator
VSGLAGTLGRVAKRREPGPKRVPRAVREQEILDAAEREFAERGYQGASMDAIAAGAGISKPLVYSYFGSKEGLYRELVGRAGRNFRATVAEVAATGRADVRMWRGILAYFDFVERYRWGWTVLYSQYAGGGELARELDANRAAVTDQLADLFVDVARASGMAEELLGEVRVQAHTFEGAAEGLGRRWLQHPDEPKELQALRLMNFAWRGIERLIGGDVWFPPDDS